MSIIYQKDKRSGITYAYENKAWWDKEKKQSRSKRRLIGRLDEMTGEIVPTDGRCRKDKTKEVSSAVKPGPVPFSESRHLFYGATYLLESFSDNIGLTEDLRTCFPEDYREVLSIAFYLILEDNNPLYRFEKWHLTHKHPYGKDICSPRSSELFSRITDSQIQKFFTLQARDV